MTEATSNALAIESNQSSVPMFDPASPENLALRMNFHRRADRLRYDMDIIVANHAEQDKENVFFVMNAMAARNCITQEQYQEGLHCLERLENLLFEPEIKRDGPAQMPVGEPHIADRTGVNYFICRKAQSYIGTWKDESPLANLYGVVNSVYHMLPKGKYGHREFIDTFLDLDAKIPYTFIWALCKYYGINEDALLCYNGYCEYEQDIRKDKSEREANRQELESTHGEMYRILRKNHIDWTHVENIGTLRQLLNERWYEAECTEITIWRMFTYGMIEGKRVERARRHRKEGAA